MKVTEIFISIQGESSLQGFPCVFVRLAGCNLNCSYCDTPYARSGGGKLSIHYIVGMVVESHIPFVCITGGEPLIQEETPLLIKMLIERGFKVSIETNGTFDASGLHPGAVRIIDIKCPGSNEFGKTCMRNIAEKRPSDEFKFVITGRSDFDYARGFAEEHRLVQSNTILISPVFPSLNPQTAAQWLIRDMPYARLNLQLHKYIWQGGNERENGFILFP